MSRLDACDPVPETPLEADMGPFKESAGRTARIMAKVGELTSKEGVTVESIHKLTTLVRQLKLGASQLGDELEKISEGIPQTTNERPLSLPSVPPDADQGVLREEEE